MQNGSLSAHSDLTRILLVDDEQDISKVLKRGLEGQGFTVDAYDDPVKALAEYKPNYYDCNILDIRMPGMSGFDLARAIWLKQPNAQVCFLSAFEIYQNEADKVFKDFNTRCFVKKPVAVKALAEHVKSHMIAAR